MFEDSSDQPLLELPASRTMLRALVVAVVLPLALIGSSASSFFCCSCSWDSTANSDFFAVGFLSATMVVEFPDPDGSTIVANKKRTNVFLFIAGVPVFFAEGQLDVDGTFTVAESRQGKLPKKVDLEVEHIPAGERGRRQGERVLKSTMKIKNGKVDQQASLAGFVADVDDRVKVFLKPKGGDISNDQTAQLTLGYQPSGRGVLTALRQYGAVGARAAAMGRELMESVPVGSMVIPALIGPGLDPEARLKKTRVVRVVSGVEFDTVSADVQLGGAFIGADSTRASAPKKIKVKVTLKDKDGKTKLSVQYKLNVNGNAVTTQTKAFDAVEVAVDDVLDIDVTPKGGSFDPSEPFFFFVTVTPT